MTPENWALIKSVFYRALAIDPAKRDSWVRQQVEMPSVVADEVRRLVSVARDETEAMPEAEAVPEHPRFPTGQVLLGRFEIQAYLGSGAMGDVYRAKDRTLNEDIALKAVRSHLVNQSDLIVSLRREVQLARRIRHDNTCQIFEFHQDPSRTPGALGFLTMELLEGETLATRIARGSIPQPEALAIARDIAKGLEAIHSASLIHRDLKPANVFLVGDKDSSYTRAVIADFGLCFDERQPVTETLTLFGPDAIVGTPAYMSPEQLLGKGATKKSDVYAFGVVLYEMVTGQPPFTGQTPFAIALRRLQEETPSPRSLAPSLSLRWERIILDCLERKSDDRPASAAEIIERLAGGHGPSARLITRRSVWAFGATAATVLAGLAGFEAVSRNITGTIRLIVRLCITTSSARSLQNRHRLKQ